jgi:hypothetical protein
VKVISYSVALAVLLVPWGVVYKASSSTARSEVQAAADAAALAGAAELMISGDTATAIAAAQTIARGNSVNGHPAELRREDIKIDVPEGIFSVRTHGPALPIRLPVLRLEVSAEAAAEARTWSEDRPRVPPKRLKLIR